MDNKTEPQEQQKVFLRVNTELTFIVYYVPDIYQTSSLREWLLNIYIYLESNKE